MRPIKILAAVGSFLFVTGIMFALTAAEALAADGDTSLLTGPPMVHQDAPLTRYLFTWPEDQGNTANAAEEDQEPLESDRPDFTDSPTTVGLGRLQIESGYTYTHATAGDSTHDIHDLPELLLRYGIAERLELRVAWDEGMVFDQYTDRDSGRRVTQNGSTDLGLGFKYAMTKQDKWRPESGFVASITAPIGTPTLSSNQVDVLVNGLYSWTLTKKLSLGASTACLWTAESGDHFTQLSQSASVEYELTEKLHVYNEWYAFFLSASEDNRPQHYYNGGFTYLVTPNFQLDWRAGLGLNDAADAFFTGCGFAVRW